MAKSLDVTLRLAGSRFDNVLATKLTVAPGNPGLVWSELIALGYCRLQPTGASQPEVFDCEFQRRLSDSGEESHGCFA